MKTLKYRIGHSVVPAGQAFTCRDCDGLSGRLPDWHEIGYSKDPRQKTRKNNKK